MEPLRVKTQAISSATDVSSMILRIDDIIASKAPEEMPGPPGGGDMGGGMPPM
jgi:chaperonin GroEL (HSP60 family)